MAKNDKPNDVEEPIVATELQEAPEEPEVKEEPKEEAPQAEPEKLETEQPEEEKPEEEKPEEPEAAEGEEQTPPVSKRKAERLEKLESLVSRLKGEEKPVATPKIEGLDYGTALDADPEVVKQLEEDRQKVAELTFNQGLEQAKTIQFHTRLEIDAPKIESKYPIFNKESEDFNPAAANAINSWYLASVGYDAKTDTVANPGIRYADFVEGIMELSDSMAGAKVEKTQTNIAKQAAMTGTRPDGSSAKRLNLNKAPADMSDEELKAVLAQAGM